jgi:hypothetical protein
MTLKTPFLGCLARWILSPRNNNQVFGSNRVLRVLRVIRDKQFNASRNLNA